VKAIRPAVKRTQGLKGDPVENAVQANVQDIAARLRATGPILAAKVNAGSLKVIGATVSLSTGKVELVPERQ
jgi:carbonic anhydrase